MNLRQATPWLLLVLLPAAGGSLSAQEDRPRADDSFDTGRMAEPPSAPDPSPPDVPSADTPSADAPPDVPSDPLDSSTGDPPDDSSSGDAPDSSGDLSDSPDGDPSPGRRYAVPVTELPEPHRQPPSRDRNPPDPPVEPPPPDDDYGYTDPDPYVESDASYDQASSPGGWVPFGRRYRGRDVLGALDLDLSPGRTQIYLDGQYLGIVDQYDGWPSYLLLEPGDYDLVFYLDGYKTLTRRVAVYPGAKIEINDRLESGPSVRPEDLDR